MSMPKAATSSEEIINGTIGEVMLCALPRPPVNWLPCDGKELEIERNAILFSVIETRFGGDGLTTFKLPDLRGRVPIHYNQGPIGSGQASSEQDRPAISLTAMHLPSHTHDARFTGESQKVKVQRNVLVMNKIGQAEPKAGGYLGKGGSGDSSAPIYLSQSDQTKESVPLKGTDITFKIAISGKVEVHPFGGQKPVSVVIPHVKMMWCICAIGDYPDF